MATYTLPLRSRVLRLPAQALGLGGAGVMYATIEGGVVTAVNFGPLPTSTDDILYHNLTLYETFPEVGWYFSDICQTFSAFPPTIPAGDIAPPYTPGGTPPVPGDPNYPESELPPTDDPAPLANTAPVYLSFHADGAASFTVTGTGPLEEVNPLMRSIVRIEDICAVRLHAMVDTPDANLTLKLCFSTDDGVTWEELSPGKTGPRVPLGAAGAVVGTFLNVDPAVSGDTLLGLCVEGSGTAILGNVFATLYVKTSDGLCIEINEGGCELSVEKPTYAEDWEDYATFGDWVSWIVANEGSQSLFQVDEILGSGEIVTDVALAGRTNSVKAMVQGFDEFGLSFNQDPINSAYNGTYALKLVLQLGSPFNVDEDGGSPVSLSSGVAFWLFAAVQRLATTGARRGVGLFVQNGDLIVVQGTNGLNSPFSLLDTIGPVSDFAGEDAQFIMACDFPDLSTWRVRFYADLGCTGSPTLIYEHTEARLDEMVGDILYVADQRSFNCMFCNWFPDTLHEYWIHQFEITDDPTLFGVA